MTMIDNVEELLQLSNLNKLNIPEKKIRQLIKANIYSIEDLLSLFPTKYIDFRTPTLIKDITETTEFISVVGQITEIHEKNKMIIITVEDCSNEKITIVWFNQNYILEKIRVNMPFIFCGKVEKNSFYSHRFTMSNPVYFSGVIESGLKIFPIYKRIDGMSNLYLTKLISQCLNMNVFNEYLEPEILNKYRLPSINVSYNIIHRPRYFEDIEYAKYRVIFDKLFKLNFTLEQNKRSHIKNSYNILSFEKATYLKKNLPFILTQGQKEALTGLCRLFSKKERFDALLQGDVGSGKTIVAIFVLLIFAENGYQGTLMAPTSILAKQHYNDCVSLLENLGITCAYLDSGTKKSDRIKIISDLKSGKINILVGTHAILSNEISFKNLAISIVDEEHRFGVLQRDKLKTIANQGVSSINMTATPIPRSLALAVFGDNTHVFTIHTLPEGRIPVKTALLSDASKGYKFIEEEIKKNHQAYIVCPAIEENENIKMDNLIEVEKTAKALLGNAVRIGVLHGKLKNKQKRIEEEIEKFRKGEYDVLISTTIIEIGVNVPNATVMMILSAERFGLAQLHQLRGRVGRGREQGYCILCSEQNTDRLRYLCSTTDGYEISKIDLEQRGSGHLLGTIQSGRNDLIDIVIQYSNLNASIKDDIIAIMNDFNRLNYYNSHDLTLKE